MGCILAKREQSHDSLCATAMAEDEGMNHNCTTLIGITLLRLTFLLLLSESIFLMFFTFLPRETAELE